MTNQSDPVIINLIATGRQKLADAETLRRTREAEQEQTRQSAIAARSKEAWEALGTLLPDSVLYHAGRYSDVEPEGWNDVLYLVEIPGCSAITITLKREQTGIVDGQYTYAYKPSPNVKNGVERGIYRVDYLGIVPLYSDDVQVGYNFGPTGHHAYTDDLSVALAVAAEQGARVAKLEAEAEAQTAELHARAVGRQAAIDQKQRHATTERDALLDLLGNDPILLALLKVAIAVKQERAGYVESIDNLHAAIETQGESYQRRIDEKQREAVRAVNNAKDDADRAQREADDLQAKLARLKRQTQYA